MPPNHQRRPESAVWAVWALSAATQALQPLCASLCIDLGRALLTRVPLTTAASSPLAHPSHHTPAESPQPSSTFSVPPPGPPVARGRALTASGRTASSRSQTPVVLAPSNNSSPDRNIERKPSVSYGHHRQTSIVHGIGIQHSRNTSFVNSPATSPLSPLPLPVIAAGNGSPDGTAMTQDSVTEAFTVAGVHVAAAGAGSTYSSAGPSIASTGSTPASNAARKPERVQSGRRKEHHHQRSQSRHPQNTNEVRTMSEYAMTHLFHEVSTRLPIPCFHIY